MSTSTDTQTLLDYLTQHENFIPRFYIDIYGNLTGGTGTELVNNNGDLANADLMTNQLSGDALTTAQIIIDLYQPIADKIDIISVPTLIEQKQLVG